MPRASQHPLPMASLLRRLRGECGRSHHLQLVVSSLNTAVRGGRRLCLRDRPKPKPPLCMSNSVNCIFISNIYFFYKKNKIKDKKRTWKRNNRGRNNIKEEGEWTRGMYTSAMLTQWSLSPEHVLAQLLEVSTYYFNPTFSISIKAADTLLCVCSCFLLFVEPRSFTCTILAEKTFPMCLCPCPYLSFTNHLHIFPWSHEYYKFKA